MTSLLLTKLEETGEFSRVWLLSTKYSQAHKYDKVDGLARMLCEHFERNKKLKHWQFEANIPDQVIHGFNNKTQVDMLLDATGL